MEARGRTTTTASGTLGKRQMRGAACDQEMHQHRNSDCVVRDSMHQVLSPDARAPFRNEQHQKSDIETLASHAMDPRRSGHAGVGMDVDSECRLSHGVKKGAHPMHRADMLARTCMQVDVHDVS